MEEAATLTRIAPTDSCPPTIATTEYQPAPSEPPPLRITLALATWQAITRPPEPSPGPGRGELAELQY